MSTYEERQEARREQLLRRAERFEAAARTAQEGAERMASIIPLGQPILVGHYSEHRDRRYRERIHARYQRVSEFAAIAQRCREQAASVGRAGISSDDEDAIPKLRERIAHLEKVQAQMVAANRLVRKQDRAGLLKMGLTEQQVETLFTPDFAGRLGFPDYKTKNNNANIRRLKERIVTLERAATRTYKEEDWAGCTYREDPEENRVSLTFPAKPASAIIAALRAVGFKWSPTRGSWVRMLNNSAIQAARYVREKIQVKAEPGVSTVPGPDMNDRDAMIDAGRPVRG